jgi:fatty-acyl-CoA synthase
VIDALLARGLKYRQGYGLTESCASGSSLALEDDSAVAGSVGRAFFNVEFRIADDLGADVVAGTEGELLLRGRPIFREYWRKPEETAAAFDGDWFRTGDIARMDTDGYIWIVDRKKDIIISGGENISSAEVEKAVISHPAVREVAVLGVRDDYWGEVPIAYVSLRAGHALDPDALIEHCRSLIARYKCPSTVVIVDELPKTTNGKIDKKQLRDHWRERAQENESGQVSEVAGGTPA